MLALDVSNWSGHSLTEDALIDLRDHYDVGLIVVQAINPPIGYPPGVTREQIDACLNVGMPVGAYIWQWFSSGMDDIKRKLDLLSGYEGKLVRLWMDAEDTYGSASIMKQNKAHELDDNHRQLREHRLNRQGPRDDSAPKLALGLEHNGRIDLLQQSLALADAFPTIAGSTGIYSGAWWWAPYMGNTNVFSKAGRVVWPADYDGDPDTSVWVPFGGWTTDQIAMKQYQGTTDIGAVKSVDISSVSAFEAALVQGGAGVPAPEDPAQRVQDLTIALSDVVNADGEIRIALAASGKLKTITAMRNSLKAIDARLDAIRTQFLG